VKPHPGISQHLTSESYQEGIMTPQRWSHAWYGWLFLIVLITGYSGDGTSDASAAATRPSASASRLDQYLEGLQKGRSRHR
jgi:hypothetical protein